MNDNPNRQQFDALIAMVEKVAAQNIILAGFCGHLVARVCASSTKPEEMFQQIVESMEDSVSAAIASDPARSSSHGMSETVNLVKERASSWLSAYLNSRQ